MPQSNELFAPSIISTYFSSDDVERVGGIYLVAFTGKIYSEIHTGDLAKVLESGVSVTYSIKSARGNKTSVSLTIDDPNVIDKLCVMKDDGSLVRDYPDVSYGSSKPLEGIVAESGEHILIKPSDYEFEVQIYPGN